MTLNLCREIKLDFSRFSAENVRMLRMKRHALKDVTGMDILTNVCFELKCDYTYSPLRPECGDDVERVIYIFPREHEQAGDPAKTL